MHSTVNLQITKALLYFSIFIFSSSSNYIFSTAESQGLGGMRVCRMGDTEQCRELVLGWVVDTNNKQEMAVRTEDGWRKIMVSSFLVIIVIVIISSTLSLETQSLERASRTSGIRGRRSSRMTDRGHVIEVRRSPGSRMTL